MKRSAIALVGIGVLVTITVLGVYYGVYKFSDVTVALPAVIIAGIVGLAIWGFRRAVEEATVDQPNLTIQGDSLRFNEYPFIIVTSQGVLPMSNTIYGELKVENNGNVQALGCEVEVIFKSRGTERYRSRIISADSTRGPNPMSHDVDPRGGTAGFHPICLRLNDMLAFIPNHSEGAPGAFSGTLVPNDQYQITARPLLSGRGESETDLGNLTIPQDLLRRAVLPNDVQVMVNRGGVAVFLENHEGTLRPRLRGNHTDDILATIFRQLVGFGNLDNSIDDNGTLKQVVQDGERIILVTTSVRDYSPDN